MSELIDGRYEVLAKIKDGGMGSVFKVRHVHLDEVRVVKLMRPRIGDDPHARVRFLKEAKLAKGLEHPNIATLIDFAEDREGALYMAMEFVDGPGLNEAGARGDPLPLEAAVGIGVQVLRALGYLHRRGIVHRDVSPENVLLTLGPDGAPVAKLIDFGIAKVAEDPSVTQAGVFVGKLKYSSPEQLGGLGKEERIDGRSDVYSMGAVLYLLLSGELLYRADTPQAWAMSHMMKPPRSFDETEAGGRVPPELRRIVLTALEKRREERWESADAMADALDAWLAGVPAERRAEASAEVAFRVQSYRDTMATLEAATGFFPASASVPVGGALPGAAPDAAPPPVPLSPVAATPPPPATPLPRSEPSARPASAAPVTPAELPLPLPDGAARPVRRPSTPSAARLPAPGPARSRVPLVAGAAAVLALAVAGGLLLSRKGEDAAGEARPGSLLLTSTPWAVVVELKSESGADRKTEGMTTPVRLELPAGRYRITLRGTNAGAGEATVTAEVAPGGERSLHVSLPGFDLERAVRAYAP